MQRFARLVLKIKQNLDEISLFNAFKIRNKSLREHITL